MSLSETMIKTINTAIERYMDKLVQEFDLNKEQLLVLWNGKEQKTKPKTTPTLTNIDVDDTSPERLMKCTKPELSALCKSKGLKCSGNKAELIERICGKAPTETKKKSTTVSKKKKSDVSSEVVKKLLSTTPTLAIRRNRFGNMEHPETSLVFDKQTQKVIGKQNDNGNVDPLTEDDIDICKKFKFTYQIPENLGQQSSLKNVKVKELDEDSEEEEEEDSEEEEEETKEIEDSDEDSSSEEEIVIDDDDVNEEELILADDEESSEEEAEEYYEEEED